MKHRNSILVSLCVVFFGFTIVLAQTKGGLEKEDTINPFEHVNGLTPGVSKLQDAVLILGIPEATEITPKEIFEELELGGDKLVKYLTRGIYLIISSSHVDEKNLIVDSIYVQSPYKGKTPGGLYIGMPKEKALQILSTRYHFVADYGGSMDFHRTSDEKDNQDFQVWFEGKKLIRMKVFPSK